MSDEAVMSRCEGSGVSATAAGIDPRAFRDVLAAYASGVTVVSGVADGELVGFTCQAFYSVSIEPPLVSICVMNSSTSYPKLRKGGRFSISVLSNEQQATAMQFARSGTDKWAGVAWDEAPSGNPVLRDVVAWFDCELWSEVEAGDHTIVVAEVKHMGHQPMAHDPLLFFRGGFHPLGRAEA